MHASLESNLFSWLQVFTPLGRTYVDDPPGVEGWLAAIPVLQFNSVMDARLAPAQVDAAIERILIL